MKSEELLDKFYNLLKKQAGEIHEDYQCYVLSEEMAELNKELMKKLRNRERRSAIVEEMAHVHISLYMLQRKMGISNIYIEAEIENKIAQLEYDKGQL
jgi:kynureninase